MQQLMGVEGVVHPHAFGKGKAEAQLLAKCGHPRAGRGRLLGRGAVFLRQVFGEILTRLRHLRVQLEGMPMDLMRRARAFQCDGKLAVADDAPGAHDVGDDIDAQSLAVRHDWSSLAESGAGQLAHPGFTMRCNQAALFQEKGWNISSTGVLAKWLV